MTLDYRFVDLLAKKQKQKQKQLTFYNAYLKKSIFFFIYHLVSQLYIFNIPPWHQLKRKM